MAWFITFSASAPCRSHESRHCPGLDISGVTVAVSTFNTVSGVNRPVSCPGRFFGTGHADARRCGLLGTLAAYDAWYGSVTRARTSSLLVGASRASQVRPGGSFAKAFVGGCENGERAFAFQRFLCQTRRERPVLAVTRVRVWPSELTAGPTNVHEQRLVVGPMVIGVEPCA